MWIAFWSLVHARNLLSLSFIDGSARNWQNMRDENCFEVRSSQYNSVIFGFRIRECSPTQCIFPPITLSEVQRSLPSSTRCLSACLQCSNTHSLLYVDYKLCAYADAEYVLDGQWSRCNVQLENFDTKKQKSATSILENWKINCNSFRSALIYEKIY